MAINAKQSQAAILLSTGTSITATAAQVGVNRDTLHQWLKDDTFNAHLNSLKREIIDAARAAIQNASTLAIETIADLMQNSENDICRLNAAKEILAMAGITRALDIGSDSVETLRKEREQRALWDI